MCYRSALTDKKFMFFLSLVISCLVIFGSGNELINIDVCTEDNSTEISYYSSKNVTTEQCGCDIKTCVRKCCKPGYYLHKKNCIRNNFTNSFKFKIHVNKTVPIGELERHSSFLVGVMNCKYFRLSGSNPDARFYVQEDGTLWVPTYRQFYNNRHYCVDELYSVSILLCFPSHSANEYAQVSRKISIIGMIISMPFLLATFLVYAILPESNLHRKALMNYVLTLLIAYILLVVVQLYPGSFSIFACSLLGHAIIFFFLVSFFWMNVMCLDMWFAFSGLRGFNGRRIAEKRRFLMYFAYAFGVPLLHTLVVFTINMVGDPNSSYYPGVGITKCFLTEGLPNLYYFYGPMAILITINITLFILTAVKIQKVKKETAMLKHSDSRRHSYEDDKQKFNLYVKLLFAMGINWVMEVISWAIQWKTNNNVPLYVWYLTDFCNAVYGVFIFFIFVFKKKIWTSLKRRYYVLRGKPHFAHSMSVTQTTRASNYSNTESSLADHRLSELKNGRGEERILPHH